MEMVGISPHQVGKGRATYIAPQSHRPSDSTAIEGQNKEGTQRGLSSKTTPSQMVFVQVP